MTTKFSVRNQAAMNDPAWIRMEMLSPEECEQWDQEQSFSKPPGFVGTLSPEQRARMYAVLSPAQRVAYDGMTPAQKTTFESDFADAHWDVISGASTTPAQAQQTQAYLSAAERALGLTFGTISTALANNNQQRIAEIQQAGAAEIARINAQLQMNLAPTEAIRLRYQLESLQNTQALLDAQRNQTFTYLAGAAVVLTGIYFLSQSRQNPVVMRGKSKMFLPMHLLNKSEQAKWRKKGSR